MALSITADGLSKEYRIGQYRAAYGTLRDSMAAAVRRVRATGHIHEPAETIWALNDVSFEAREGEVIGIIGPNGAGKSTLLKILTRITTPTKGRAEIRGRVGSLLEVGTGFHPELTGRENIYLNGSILGMTRREIDRNFDAIVDFSGVEKFIDTPVKRYSSGMYVRLAFSVAAHFEPEVLIVDEVLAVGDADFQRRSLGRMESIGGEGRTVLFVSHNLQGILQLCDRAILLQKGEVAMDGPTADVVGLYEQQSIGQTSERVWHDDAEAPGNDVIRLASVRVVDEDGSTITVADVRRPVGIEIGFRVLKETRWPIVPKVKLYDQHGATAFNAIDVSTRWNDPPEPGEYAATAWIPANLLNEGRMTVDADIVTIASPKLIPHASARLAVSFHVYDPVEGDSARGRFTGQWKGVVRPLLEWTTEER
jgi:lipopolysaccharide transport system ATP-binding protein